MHHSGSFRGVQVESEPDLLFNARLPMSGEAAKHLRVPEGQRICDDAESGAREVFARVKRVLESKNVAIVSLGGPSRAGKGFLTASLRALAEHEGIGVADIPMDWFYLLAEQRAELEKILGRDVTFDDPESIWYERVLQTIEALKRGESDILFPNYLYDKQGPDRLWQSGVPLPTTDKRIFIVDGIFAAHPASGIPQIADVNAFMRSDGATQAARRIQVDKERGRNTVDAAHVFFDFVAGKRNEHIDPFARGADVLIRNTMPPSELIGRIPRRNERKFLIQQDRQNAVRAALTAPGPDSFVETDLSQFVDVYAPVTGRSSDDYGRIRFVQGSEGIQQTNATLSLKNGDDVYKGTYPLYPHERFVQRYARGLLACMNVDEAIVVSKRRIEFMCGGTKAIVDGDVKAWSSRGMDLDVQGGRIVTPGHAVEFPGQLEVIDGDLARIDRIRTAIQRATGMSAEIVLGHTFGMTRAALPSGHA